MEQLIGNWSVEPSFPGAPPTDVKGHVSFEWMAGEKFVVMTWEVPVPEAPDGVAILGYNEPRGTYLQHYFDSRGVARVYEMSIDDKQWKLWRTEEDFSPLSFSQRFTGTFSDDGATIEAAWEISHDHSTWEHDFDLRYVRQA